MNAIISTEILHFQRDQVAQGKNATAEENWGRWSNPKHCGLIGQYCSHNNHENMIFFLKHQNNSEGRN